MAVDSYALYSDKGDSVYNNSLLSFENIHLNYVAFCYFKKTYFPHGSSLLTLHSQMFFGKCKEVPFQFILPE